MADHDEHSHMSQLINFNVDTNFLNIVTLLLRALGDDAGGAKERRSAEAHGANAFVGSPLTQPNNPRSS